MKCLRTDHGSEIALLAVISVGVCLLAWRAIESDDAAGASAWTAVLMAIINAIKERWTQRSVDRMGDQLATSSPRGHGEPQPVRVENDPSQPVPVEATDPPRR